MFHVGLVPPTISSYSQRQKLQTTTKCFSSVVRLLTICQYLNPEVSLTEDKVRTLVASGVNVTEGRDDGVVCRGLWTGAPVAWRSRRGARRSPAPSTGRTPGRATHFIWTGMADSGRSKTQRRSSNSGVSLTERIPLCCQLLISLTPTSRQPDMTGREMYNKLPRIKED